MWYCSTMAGRMTHLVKLEPPYNFGIVKSPHEDSKIKISRINFKIQYSEFTNQLMFYQLCHTSDGQKIKKALNVYKCSQSNGHGARGQLRFQWCPCRMDKTLTSCFPSTLADTIHSSHTKPITLYRLSSSMITVFIRWTKRTQFLT
jgi:hypothetical protein